MQFPLPTGMPNSQSPMSGGVFPQHWQGPSNLMNLFKSAAAGQLGGSRLGMTGGVMPQRQPMPAPTPFPQPTGVVGQGYGAGKVTPTSRALYQT